MFRLGNIFKNNIHFLIVFMVAIQYIGLIRLVPTYMQHKAIKSVCTKFYQVSSITNRLVTCRFDADQEYIYFFGV